MVAGAIASNKGRSGFGWFLLGVLFGPLALLFVLIAGNESRTSDRDAIRYGEKRKCPFCAEAIQFEASVCPHCRSKVAPMDRPRPPLPLWLFLLLGFGALYLIIGLAEFVSSITESFRSEDRVEAASPPAAVETAEQPTNTADPMMPPTDEKPTIYPSAFQGKMTAASDGDTWAVAKAAIRHAAHTCGTLDSAARNPEGAIQARCSNGKAYLIFGMKGSDTDFAMDCQATSKFISQPACPWAE